MNQILITGANRGIGLEFTRQYLADGATVIACCREPEQAEDLQALATHYPKQLELVGLDLSDSAQIPALAHCLGTRKLDLLISNAGVYGPKGLALGDYRAEPFAGIMQVNVLAPLLLVQALLTTWHRAPRSPCSAPRWVPSATMTAAGPTSTAPPRRPSTPSAKAWPGIWPTAATPLPCCTRVGY